jgi:hypothetical protein
VINPHIVVIMVCQITLAAGEGLLAWGP